MTPKKVALVTGASSGIGWETAKLLAAHGWSLAITARRKERLDFLARCLVKNGDECPQDGCPLVIEADISRPDQARAVVEKTVAHFGRLDVLVNNAGIQPMTWYHRIEDLPEEQWDRILGVNLKGVFLMSKHAIPEIRRQGGGAIVNMASVQGLQSMPGVPAYAASKGGVLSLTRNMALDYARENIRVTAICPGTIDSDMVRTSARAEGGDLEDNLRRYGAFHPIGRIGHPQDIANAAIFLASEKASFITGEYLCVDGGFMAQGAWASSAGADAVEHAR